MKVVIPLAGRGSRFKEAGFKLPKPLISLIKKPMIAWATANLDFSPENLIFLILREHIDNFQLDEHLKNVFSDRITIISVDRVTEGAPLTILLAKDLINSEEELLIWNGDQVFSNQISKLINELPKECSGLIPVFNSTQTKFSYAKVDSDMNVLEVAEKIPISNFATAGVYYYRHGRDFVWATEQMVRKDIRRGNEFFVCPTYNELIERGDKIKIVKISDFWPLGTPEDADYFKKYYRE